MERVRVHLGQENGDVVSAHLIPHGGQTILDPPDEEPVASLTNYVRPEYITDFAFGLRSFWYQPWRAYVDTQPARRLTRSLGINMNVADNEVDRYCAALSARGFTVGRTEVNWGMMSWADHGMPQNASTIAARLQTMVNRGIRPMILLGSHSGSPCPLINWTITLASPAAQGATTATLTPESAAQVVPRKTGFNSVGGGYLAASVLIMSMSGNVATLSRPLPAALSGAVSGCTLAYEPFGPPRYADLTPNPYFQETLDGWEIYIAGMCRFANDTIGDGNYDIEIWNELTFGSEFLWGNLVYHEPNISAPAVEDPYLDNILQVLPHATVPVIKANTNEDVLITDGFASQVPWTSVTDAPMGLHAISKHYYGGTGRYPAIWADRNIGVLPINALGVVDDPAYVPAFDLFMPEFALTGIHTETMVRDLAPYTTSIYGSQHGRNAQWPDGNTLEVWTTEYNMTTLGLVLNDPAAPSGPPFDPSISAAEAERIRTKALVRYQAAYINKGKERTYYYCAAEYGDGLSLLSSAFRSGSSDDPGPVVNALGRLLNAIPEPSVQPDPMPLTLARIDDFEGNVQFEGDGTPAHPDLRDLDMIAFLPFQTGPKAWVICLYVMTLSIATERQDVAGPRRFDLPAARYRLTIQGVGDVNHVAAYDVVDNYDVPVRGVSLDDDEIVLEVELTDSVRVLRIESW